MKTTRTSYMHEYNMLYSSYPDTNEELISYIKDNMNIDYEKLNEEINRIDNLEWKELEYTIFLLPLGTPRARYSSGSSRFYVRGAKETKDLFMSIITSAKLIYTRIDFRLDAYFPTPLTKMTPNEILLAEMEKIRPLSTPDFDNVGKTYTDSLQSVLILNDSLINPGHVERYYSLKPRVKIIIKYQDGFDSEYNRKKITSSKSYRLMCEKGE